MTDHAKKLRRHADKIGRPAGDTPAVMQAAAAHIEHLERELRAAEIRLHDVATHCATVEAELAEIKRCTYVAVTCNHVARMERAEARVAAAAMAAYGEACKGTHPALSPEISAEYPQFFPRWPNHAAAMTDRIFHEARGIMGTENYGQEEALRMAILHVMRAYSGSKGD